MGQRDQEGTVLRWRDGGVPVSGRFDDPYFSLEDGLAETRHVFLAGNDLPARFVPGFHVAELGFGTGLNLLALAEISTGYARTRYTGFEAFPMTVDDARRALKPFQRLAAQAEILLDAWSIDGFHAEIGSVSAQIIVGDARKTVLHWSDAADAWFLDGFAPSKNPELWEPELMAAVAAHTRAGGTFATYTAAGHVRRSLAAAGFTVERRAGYGQKRHMTVGRLGQ